MLGHDLSVWDFRNSMTFPWLFWFFKVLWLTITFPETLFSRFSRPCGNPEPKIWQMTLKNKRALFLCYFKLCASFRSHMWIHTAVTVQKCPIWVKIDNFFVQCDLEIWRMTLKNNRAPLLFHIKLCASFHHHMWIQTGVMVWKRLSWVLTSVTLTFDLWPWPFACTSLLSMVIIGENFMMIRWQENCQKVWQTDRQTDGLNHS